VVSSPTIEQLHWSGPTGRISWIIGAISHQPSEKCERPELSVVNESFGVRPTTDDETYFFAGWLFEVGAL
jgi:hypothetical protein